MRPLLASELETFRERFANFRDAEIRSVEILSPLDVRLTLALQDKARDFDWITLTLEFNGMKNARLVDENKLSFVDTSEGFSLLFDGSFAFGVGRYTNLSKIQNSPLFLIAQTLKYQEGPF